MAHARFEDIPTGTPFIQQTVVLSRELIEEYKGVVGDHNPLYDSESPLGRPVAPPTLGALFLFQLFHSTFPPAPGRLHASLEFEFFRPWKEGTTINVGGQVVDKYTKRGKKYFLFEVTFSDDQGADIARAHVEEVTPE